MARSRYKSNTTKIRGATPNRVVGKTKHAQHVTPLSKRARGGRPDPCVPFSPPEDWHEPLDKPHGEPRFVVQTPGAGFRHILTPKQIRARLAVLPAWMVDPLEVIQLSRMTRKKLSFPCYGMQWGTSLYLYPMEESLVEYHGQSPTPAQVSEAETYGGRWIHESRGLWKLVWTREAIEDFYLNNILMHELGHLLDDRNRNYRDRERYAEWFASHHGRVGRSKSEKRRRVRKRHHTA